MSALPVIHEKDYIADGERYYSQYDTEEDNENSVIVVEKWLISGVHSEC